MNLFNSKTKIIAHDLWAITAAWVLALLARFNFELPPEPYLSANLQALPIVVVLQAAVARHFRLYRGLWRFASLPDLWNIIRAALLGALVVGVVLFIVNRMVAIPRSMLVLYPLFLVFLLGGPRLAYRLWKDHSLRLESLAESAQRVLIIGAGTGGEAVVRDMLRARTYVPIGFIDDKPALLKSRIHGIPVLGGIDELPALTERHTPDSLIIAVPSATDAEMRRIVEACERSGRPFRTLPKLQDIVSGRVGLQALREVSIDDLLGRDKIELDWVTIQQAAAGRTILVTGGGGSIGSELCRQIAGLGPARLIVLDASEFNLYRIEREMTTRYPHLSAVFVLADVCDEVAVKAVFERYGPRTVFHAAAFKHVPILEQHGREAARNNVMGSAVIIDAAGRHGCDNFVLISTDKAVRPSSIMGATKRFAELLCERANRSFDTRYITVRFGNVLDSAGSVVPLFRDQIARGGPVTVTHPKAQRYFMTIPEACQLILEASAAGEGGEIFVLDMGQPVSISYLAEQMIRLCGKRPGEDVHIVYTGLRPGEKLSEELFYEHEHVRATGHDKLLLAQQAPADSGAVQGMFERLSAAVAAGEEVVVIELLREDLPGLGVAGPGGPSDQKVVQLPRSS